MSADALTVDSPTPDAAEVRRGPFHRLMRDPQALITGGILLLIVLAGVFASVIAQNPPDRTNLEALNLPPGSPGFPLGTDGNGRDLLSLMLHSINTASVAALIGTSAAVTVGTAGGLIGGYFDKLRSITEWVFGVIMTLPSILLLILLMPVTGGDFRIQMVIFGVLMSPTVYRVVRNQAIGVSRELYVDAARVSGVSDGRIMVRGILPVIRGPIIIASTFMVGSAITIQASLAFLGIGSAEVPSLGSMISAGFRNLAIAPTQYIWPALVLGAINVCITLFGNALRDAFEGARPKPAKITATQVSEGFEASTMAADPKALLQVRDLGIAYPSPSGELHEVVKGVTLSLQPGETLGLVGESGSGKTQTAFGILGVLPPEATVTRGSVRIDGKEILGASEPELRALRGRTIAYIPQEPMSNLDPVYRIGKQLVERICAATDLGKAEAKQRALDLLARVGIADPQRTFASYPHEISGGMAQRVLIAGAIAGHPAILIADEPTTALDVTVQAEILDLLRDLQDEMQMAIILVTHNFGVVADSCDRTSVMRGGTIVEVGETREVFRDPQHEYTRMLLDSILDESQVRTDPPAAGGVMSGAAR